MVLRLPFVCVCVCCGDGARPVTAHLRLVVKLRFPRGGPSQSEAARDGSREIAA